MTNDTLVLSRRRIRELLTPADCLDAVERAFHASRLGQAESPAPMHIHTPEGAFHAKGAVLSADHGYVAVKINSNYPGNPESSGRPTIQGVIVLFDAGSGTVLAVMDSIEITLLRTAAATALAARHLAREDARTLCICGCGQQAAAQVAALVAVRRFEQGYAWDRDAGKARAFARAMDEALGIPFEPVETLAGASRRSEVIVTCTTARTPILGAADVSPGTFIAAVGADHPDKCEIAPALMARATVVVDVLAQCLVMGDLHHAVKAGVLAATGTHAELADIVAGARPGRTRIDEIIVFDSTGTAIEDVACAALAYEWALRDNAASFNFAET